MENKIIEGNFGEPKSEPTVQQTPQADASQAEVAQEQTPQTQDPKEVFVKGVLDFYGCKDLVELNALSSQTLVFLKNIVESGNQIQVVQPFNPKNGSFVTLVFNPRMLKQTFVSAAAAIPAEAPKDQAEK